MALVKLTREQWIPFLDVVKDTTFTNNIWKRIDKSTQFELTMGEQEEDVDYICNKNPETELRGYKIEFPQEIAVYENNPVFEFIKNECYNMPTYTDALVPVLLCLAGSDKKALRCNAVLTSKVINTVDGIITFTLKPVDPITKGTYTITSGVPVFTAAATQTVTLAGTNVTYKNLAGTTITSLSLQLGQVAAVKVQADTGYTISEIKDTENLSYEQDSNGYIVVNAKTTTITASTASSATNSSNDKKGKK